MQPTQRNFGGASRRTTYLAILTTLFVVAALAAACNGDKPGLTNGGDPPPMGSDDRPIIISGGSMDVYFDHNIYRPNATGNTFQGIRGSVKSFSVYNDDASDESASLCGKTYTGDSVITIKFKKDGDGEMKVTSASNNVTISLDPGKLKLRPGSKNQHFSKSADIAEVIYTDGSTTVSCPGIPSNGNVTIAFTTK
jgi:hypothetical protein